MTRYLKARALGAVVSTTEGVGGVEGLVRQLNDRGEELVPINLVSPNELLPTYEVRLARALDDEGPPTDGLPGFVDALRTRTECLEQFGFTGAAERYVGLLDCREGSLLALVVVHAPNGSA